jgi:hypothetical protein
MKHLLAILTVILLSAACAPALPPDSPTNHETPSGPPNYAPRPGDENLTRGEVFLDSADILAMESFPVQFAVILIGNLPTPCHELRVVVNDPDPQKRIKLEVYSLSDPNAVCIQMLEPFEQSITLGSFPAGHYTFWVNDQQVAEFDA